MGKFIEKITNSIRYQELTSMCFKLFIVLSLFFPLYQSNMMRHYYFVGFLWPYAFLVLGMIMLLLKLFRIPMQNKKTGIWFCSLSILFIGLSFFVANQYHKGWMWEEIHLLVAFLFVTMIIVWPNWNETIQFDFVGFLMKCILISMIAAIIFYLMGYSSVRFYNRTIELKTLDEMLSEYAEKRMSWIWYHKSQFALLQIGFIAFFHRFRSRFQSIAYYIMAQAVFVICLYLSHSWTAIGGLCLLVAGLCLDQFIVLWKKNNKKFRTAAAIAIPLLFVAGLLILKKAIDKLSAERDLSTLGSRIPIWRGAVKYIMEHPNGVGLRFGKKILQMSNGAMTKNCHNVFLNAFYRFSIPVGILFTIIILSFFVLAILRSKSWFSVGFITGTLLLFTIDYCFLTYGVALFMILVYYALFYDEKDSAKTCSIK